MGDFNRHQMFGALTLLVAALFVMAGLPGPWRRQLRRRRSDFLSWRLCSRSSKSRCGSVGRAADYCRMGRTLQPSR